MKAILLLTATLLFCSSVQAKTNKSIVYSYDRNQIIDLTTIQGERFHIEDIEDGYIQIPNVKITKEKLILKAINGKFPLQEIMMASAIMIGPNVPINEGGDMGGGGK